MTNKSEAAGTVRKRPVSYRELEERFDKPRIQQYWWLRARVERLYPDRTGPAFDGLVLWLVFNLENLHCADDLLQDVFEKAEMNGWSANTNPVADMKGLFESDFNAWMIRAKAALSKEIQNDPRFIFAVRCLSRSRLTATDFDFKWGFSDFLSRFKVSELELKAIPEEFVLETLECYQKHYVTALTVQDALEIIIDVGRLFDLAKGEKKA